MTPEPPNRAEFVVPPKAAGSRLAFVVPRDAAGERLDTFLARQVPDRSRSDLQRLMRRGLAWRNGRLALPSERLAAGDTIALELLPPEPVAAVRPAPSTELRVLYADATLIVVDKPSGLVVHPAAGHQDDTLVNALVHRFPDLLTEFSGPRPGVVHRLDRDTSGVLVVARTVAAAESLQRQFRRRTVRKVYLALVRGEMTPPAGLIDAPVGRDPRHRQRMAALATGRTSQTAYRVLAVTSGYSWLELQPQTGRTHQIRVHLAAVGHPVAGDRTYGRRDRQIDRMALHAWQLEIEHPATGDRMAFQAPVPRDIADAVERLFGPGTGP